LLGAAAQGHKVRVEVGHVGLEHLGGIALGVHRHEHALQFAAIRAQGFLHLGQLGQGGGAHIRALGVAEEQRHHLALEVLQAAGLAVVVGQLEILGIVGAGDVHRLELRLGLRTSTQKADRAHCQAA
jgi:hypothetical protein